jgi:PAS domain S-box-containing protein/putative nucleotidyltransferase with HDIG domain
MYLGECVDQLAQRALLDAVAAPAFFVDCDYRYLAFNEANAAVVRMLYGTDIAIGESLLETISPGDRDALCVNLNRSLAGETHSDGSWYGRDPGARRFYNITYAPYRRDGAILGVAAVAVDETELREAQKALRISEEKFVAAFRSSPDSININRLSDGLYLEINEGFTRLTGYTTDDTKGRTSIELSIWDDPADRARLVRGLQEDGSVDRLEARFRCKDGSVTTAEMSARLIEVGGERCILSVTRDISERKRVQEELQASYARLEHMNHDIVQTLGLVVEARDPYTQGHEQRSAELCRLIAAHMGMSERTVATLEMAALLHDIGKLTVPAEILTKPGALSIAEFNIIKEHPRHSYEILSGIAFDRPIADIVLQHHERMDGSGYPSGLRGDEICLEARILAVADVVEAMATHRPYRPSLGLDAAVDELRAHPEKYDHDVVEAVLELFDGDRIEL